MAHQQIGWKMEHTYTELPDMFFTQTNPTPVQDPALILFNDVLAKELGLNGEMLKEEGAQIFAGNQLADEFNPIAQAYAGHQFGNFTMLGDGRAILLGEQKTPTGELRDIQLKGAGKTPYSRGGDGRAGVGPMLREYIISEAMHGLGIPTSRALAVTSTGEPIIRETMLDGAIVTRVASSHLRVGTFQYAAAYGTKDDIRALADYAIQRHDPDLVSSENKFMQFLKRVIDRQASLIAKWQLVGFIHGVMNTDNMTISGETIDYGPCAFMNTFDPSTVFSSIDIQGRYAFANQPNIGGWNIARFAESLLPLFLEDEDQAVELAQEAISNFGPIYYEYWLMGMREKLGLMRKEDGDAKLIDALLTLMEDHQADYTTTFIDLTFDSNSETSLERSSAFSEWKIRWKKRLEKEERSSEQIFEHMKSVNPAIIPRNDLVEEALKAAVDHQDFSLVKRLNELLQDPYAHTEAQEKYMRRDLPSGPYQTFCGT